DSIGPNSYCPHQYVRLNKYMGVPVNCDEFVFIGAAVRPAFLIEQGFQRQNRPGYIILGSVIGYSIYYILTPLHTSIKTFAQKKLSSQFSPKELDKAVLYGSVYSGFIIINIAILFFSMLLFEKSLIMFSSSWKNKEWLLWLCLVMLISNQVTKTFFWTAHQQMFTIFTPIACIYASIIIQRSQSFKKTSLIIAAISGLLLFVYGNFILLLPIIIFNYFICIKNVRKIFTVSSLISATLITSIFLMPTLCWIGYLKSIGISYYNHEIVQFRHFVWMSDSMQISMGHFLNTFYNNTLEFLKTSGCLLLAFLFLIATVLCRLQFRNDINRGKEKITNLKIGYVLFPSFLLFAIFLWLIGSYADRLTFSLAPLILFVGVVNLNKTNLTLKTQYAIALLILMIHIYTVFFNAPHFSEKLFFQ
ncbi:MAG: hypothetical protein ABUT20_29425, partial [Bacteroidota bacterium]